MTDFYFILPNTLQTCVGGGEFSFKIFILRPFCHPLGCAALDGRTTRSTPLPRLATPLVMRKITAQPKFKFADHLDITDFCAEILEDTYFLRRKLKYEQYCCLEI